MSSNSCRVMRACVCTFGSSTGMVASESDDGVSLRRHALLAQQAGAEHEDAVGVETVDGVADGAAHVHEHRLVEVDAAEAFDAFGLAHRWS